MTTIRKSCKNTHKTTNRQFSLKVQLISAKLRSSPWVFILFYFILSTHTHTQYIYREQRGGFRDLAMHAKFYSVVVGFCKFLMCERSAWQRKKKILSYSQPTIRCEGHNQRTGCNWTLNESAFHGCKCIVGRKLTTEKPSSLIFRTRSSRKINAMSIDWSSEERDYLFRQRNHQSLIQGTHTHTTSDSDPQGCRHKIVSTWKINTTRQT